jgi:hypothetical protein
MLDRNIGKADIPDIPVLVVLGYSFLLKSRMVNNCLLAERSLDLIKSGVVS